MQSAVQCWLHAIFGSSLSLLQLYYHAPEAVWLFMNRALFVFVCRKWHPNRKRKQQEDGRGEVQKRVAAAYETLSDPERRKLYDQFGEEALKQGGPGGPGEPGGPGGGFQFHGDPFEMFGAFFGGGGGGGGSRQFHFSSGEQC